MNPKSVKLLSGAEGALGGASVPFSEVCSYVLLIILV